MLGKEIIHSDVAQVFFDEENKLMSSVYLPSSANVAEEEFRKHYMKLLDYIIELHPKYFLLDMRELRFVISDEMQQWLTEMLVKPIVDRGLEKFAVVTDNDFFKDLIVRRFLDETKKVKEAEKVPSEFFESEEEAIKWLLE